MKVILLAILLPVGAWAAEIMLVYPRLEEGQDTFRYNPEFDSTFILGQVRGFNREMSLTCNGIPIFPSQDGAFLAFLPIPWQAETLAWNLSLNLREAETSRLVFPFAVLPPPKPISWTRLDSPAAFCVRDRNAHTRTAVGGSYHLFPDSGTVLTVSHVSPNWLRFYLSDGITGVIERRFVDSIDVDLSDKEPTGIGNGVVSQQGDTTRIEFSLNSRPLLECTVVPEGNVIDLTVYGTLCAVDRIRYLAASRDKIEDITWRQLPWGTGFRIHLADPIVRGYRLFTTDSSAAIELYYESTKPKNLRARTIVLDPGHGGTAQGAMGPRGSKEKDIVLKWSELLEKELKKLGAEVIRTRTVDTALSLPDRVKLARDANTDVFLSLHCNALPDGENPFHRHGCGMYYYQTLSRPLAMNLQNAILRETGLNDDGIFDANFAVARPTDFPAVLIEAAYLIHPDEERKLMDDKFLLKLSRGVANGLLDYFSKEPAR